MQKGEVILEQCSDAMWWPSQKQGRETYSTPRMESCETEEFLSSPPLPSTSAGEVNLPYCLFGEEQSGWAQNMDPIEQLLLYHCPEMFKTEVLIMTTSVSLSFKECLFPPCLFSESKSKLLSGAKHKVAKAASVPGRNGTPTFAAVAAGYDKSPGNAHSWKSKNSLLSNPHALPCFCSVYNPFLQVAAAWRSRQQLKRNLLDVWMFLMQLVKVMARTGNFGQSFWNWRPANPWPAPGKQFALPHSD